MQNNGEGGVDCAGLCEAACPEQGTGLTGNLARQCLDEDGNFTAPCPVEVSDKTKDLVVDEVVNQQRDAGMCLKMQTSDTDNWVKIDLGQEREVNWVLIWHELLEIGTLHEHMSIEFGNIDAPGQNPTCYDRWTDLDYLGRTGVNFKANCHATGRFLFVRNPTPYLILCEVEV